MQQFFSSRATTKQSLESIERERLDSLFPLVNDSVRSFSIFYVDFAPFKRMFQSIQNISVNRFNPCENKIHSFELVFLFEKAKKKLSKWLQSKSGVHCDIVHSMGWNSAQLVSVDWSGGRRQKNAGGRMTDCVLPNDGWMARWAHTPFKSNMQIENSTT